MFKNQRTESVVLTIIASVFVLAGIIMMFNGEPLFGLLAVIFFGSGLGIGVHQLVRPDQELPAALGIAGALGFAIAGGLLIYGELNGQNFMGRRQALALPIGVLAVIFFGGGALLLIAQEIRKKARSRDEADPSQNG